MNLKQKLKDFNFKYYNAIIKLMYNSTIKHTIRKSSES